MPQSIRWLLYSLGALLLLLVLLALAARVYVGGVNVPLGSGQVDEVTVGERLKAPEGFTIGIYANGVPNARILRFTRGGDLLVANPDLGKVVVLERDRDGDGHADGMRTLIENLHAPNGVDFWQNWLYIAETDAIGRVPFDHGSGTLTGTYERIVTGLPGGGNHYKKPLRFGPDGRLYVVFGSSCNACIEEDQRRATMNSYDPDGKSIRVIATGLRNSAGFDWSPRDGGLYATDNGRDMLGDDFPPCELNRIEPGGFYGWPFANGDRIPDPDFGEGREAEITASIAPVYRFRAHNAPLGILFPRSGALPDAYRGAALVALHGSWNRSRKDGYKVISLHWREDDFIEARDFVSGFLRDGDVIGRPAELAEGPDGAIYVSDDYAGAVYRVVYVQRAEGAGA